jgi:hypothetical protein
MSVNYHQPLVSSGAHIVRPTDAFQRCNVGAGQINGQAPGSAAHYCQSHVATPAPFNGQAVRAKELKEANTFPLSSGSTRPEVA